MMHCVVRLLLLWGLLCLFVTPFQLNSGKGRIYNELYFDAGPWPTIKSQRAAALANAIRSNDISLVEKLLSMGANLNPKNKFKMAPLDLACRYGHEAIVSLLLKLGADQNRLGESGFTPLHGACFFGKAGVVSLLLDAGAGQFDKNKDLRTPLHFACSRSCSSSQIVSLLLEAGADPNHQDGWGMTPLHWACDRNKSDSKREKVRLLLKAGADPNCQFPYKQTPLNQSCKSGNSRSVSLLLRAGADQEYLPCVKKGLFYDPLFTLKKSVVIVLCERGADHLSRGAIPTGYWEGCKFTDVCNDIVSKRTVLIKKILSDPSKGSLLEGMRLPTVLQESIVNDFLNIEQ